MVSVDLILRLSTAFLLPLYLIFRAGSKGLFKQYSLLYVYLVGLVLVEVIRWMGYAVFSEHSQICYVTYQTFYFIHEIPTVPLVLIKFLLICWLFWIVLSNDYPAIRFGFVLVFLVTTFVFLFFLVGSGTPQHSSIASPLCVHPEDPEAQHVNQKLFYANQQLERINMRTNYFNVAGLLLVSILSLIIYAFKLPVGANLKGIVIGLNANLILIFASNKFKSEGNLNFVPLMIMLLIFCRYLSYKKVFDSLRIDEQLKSYDSKLSEFLIRARLYNAFTNRFFFNFVLEGNSAGQRAFFEKYRDQLKKRRRK